MAVTGRTRKIAFDQVDGHLLPLLLDLQEVGRAVVQARLLHPAAQRGALQRGGERLLIGQRVAVVDADALGRLDEAEPCYERVNDGCNGIDRVFALLGCGESVTGTVTTDGPRDTDWYAIELAETTTVTWRIRAEFPAQAVLVTGPCEGPLEALRLVETGDCGELLLEETLPPGAHRLVIAPGLEAMPVRGGIHCDLEDPEDPPEEPLEPSWFGLRYLITVECGATGPVGDLDGDGRVDGADLLIVLSRWDTDDPVADLDGSGTVDGADILQVLGAWTG